LFDSVLSYLVDYSAIGQQRDFYGNSPVSKDVSDTDLPDAGGYPAGYPAQSPDFYQTLKWR
jgi:hypothetical protein